MQIPNCLNCENPVLQGQRFCSACGQKAEVHRLSLHDVGHDALHYFTHADKGIFSLIWTLFSKPGLVAREFVNGKRKTYFPPLNFFLIVAAISVFMSSLAYNYQVKQISQQKRNVPAVVKQHTKVKESTKAQLAAMQRGANVGKFFGKYSNIVSICAVPLMSFLMWLMYRKGRYNYTEHLVANMYIGGFTLLFYALVFKSAVLVGVKGPFMLYLFFFFELIYRIVSYYYFMDQRTKRSLVKAIWTNVVVVTVWVMLTGTLTRIYITNGFWGLMF